MKPNDNAPASPVKILPLQKTKEDVGNPNVTYFKIPYLECHESKRVIVVSIATSAADQKGVVKIPSTFISYDVAKDVMEID